MENKINSEGLKENFRTWGTSLLESYFEMVSEASSETSQATLKALSEVLEERGVRVEIRETGYVLEQWFGDMCDGKVVLTSGGEGILGTFTLVEENETTWKTWGEAASVMTMLADKMSTSKVYEGVYFKIVKVEL